MLLELPTDRNGFNIKQRENHEIYRHKFTMVAVRNKNCLHVCFVSSQRLERTSRTVSIWSGSFNFTIRRSKPWPSTKICLISLSCGTYSAANAGGTGIATNDAAVTVLVAVKTSTSMPRRSVVAVLGGVTASSCVGVVVARCRFCAPPVVVDGTEKENAWPEPTRQARMAQDDESFIVFCFLGRDEYDYYGKTDTVEVGF